MNVLITAGGTTEMIDAARGISNFGTGRLGALICEELLKNPAVGRIYYICSNNAVRLALSSIDKGRVCVSPVRDTAQLEEEVRRVCSLPAGERPDAVVHSMAVSDYRVRAVSRADLLAGKSEDEILEAPSIVADGEKLSSGIEGLVLLMERTPKVISLFRPLLPDALLIGFKLLNSVPESDLLDAAAKLIRINGLDYALANDSAYFAPSEGHPHGRHIGHLLAANGAHEVFEGKMEIAKAISACIAH
jgi:phosphopantothenate-cysteine ligase